jgi:hypothetical protein
MSNNTADITEKLFKIVLGSGNKKVTLFTEDGKTTVDPTEARRIFVGDLKMMINIIETSSGDEIIVNLSAGTNIAQIRNLLTMIKNLATENIAEYTMRTFGKEISPKDFEFQTQQTNVTEGFNRWHGSAKRSYQQLENARIVVNHSRSVDPEARGSRTRQIEAIFIENSSGERFKFPTKNITAARAMTKHVNEGGTPFDEFGSHIYNTMEELNQLKKFQRHNKKQDFFENSEITTEIQERVSTLRSSLKQMSGPKGYKHHFESFKNVVDEVSTEQLDELRDTVTVRSFDENIAESLPYVARIIETHNNKTTANGLVGKFAQYVLKNTDGKFEIDGDIDSAESPEYQTFNNADDEILAWIVFIAPMITNGKVKSALNMIKQSMHNVNDKYKQMLLSALKVVAAHTKTVEMEDCDCKPIDSELKADLQESLRKYSRGIGF